MPGSLELFSRGPLEIHRVRHRLPLKRRCQFLYASDLHLNPWTRHVSTQLTDLVKAQQPDFTILGGDLVDLPWTIGEAQRLVEGLCQQGPVLVVTGNHDRWVGLARLQRALVQAGAILLDTPWTEPQSGLRVCATTSDPATPNSLLAAHDPQDFDCAAAGGFPLVLAGHLHGCQMILWERHGLQYPGAWFYRYNGREFHRHATRMVVSLGVNDTLPIRWNCPREVLAVEIQSE